MPQPVLILSGKNRGLVGHISKPVAEFAANVKYITVTFSECEPYHRRFVAKTRDQFQEITQAEFDLKV